MPLADDQLLDVPGVLKGNDSRNAAFLLCSRSETELNADLTVFKNTGAGIHQRFRRKDHAAGIEFGSAPWSIEMQSAGAWQKTDMVERPEIQRPEAEK